MKYILTKKRIKNIILRLDKNGNIKVSAPIWVNNDVIDRFVDSKKEWIESRKNIIKNNLPKYANGEKIVFFDNVYILNIILCNKNKVDLNNDILNVYTKDNTNVKKIESMINHYFTSLSNDYINSIIIKYSNAISRKVESVKFRNMTSRWGSCNVKNATITLNTILFRKPIICLEYVLLHELVHLVYANHSRDFYNLLESLMPNWREIKFILES